MNFIVEKSCPGCGKLLTIDCEDYIDGTSSSEKSGMGIEVFHYIECDCYKCNHCGAPLRLNGSIIEYPVGVCECDSITLSPVN